MELIRTNPSSANPQFKIVNDLGYDTLFLRYSHKSESLEAPAVYVSRIMPIVKNCFGYMLSPAHILLC